MQPRSSVAKRTKVDSLCGGNKSRSVSRVCSPRAHTHYTSELDTLARRTPLREVRCSWFADLSVHTTRLPLASPTSARCPRMQMRRWPPRSRNSRPPPCHHSTVQRFRSWCAPPHSGPVRHPAQHASDSCSTCCAPVVRPVARTPGSAPPITLATPASTHSALLSWQGS